MERRKIKPLDSDEIRAFLKATQGSRFETILLVTLFTCNELGERVSPHTVYHSYKKIVASIGLPKARLHDLRHPYVKYATTLF